MTVSIVITVRDEDPDVLAATLAGLHATTRHLQPEIVVVDDGSLVPVRCSEPRVRLLRNPQPMGVAPARRAGARLAEGDVLVWLDAHMSFGNGWLEQMLVQAQSGALLCSPFWSYDLSDCMCWGADFVWCPDRDYAAQRYPGFGLRHRVEWPKHAVVEVPMVIGACYAMQRRSYDRIGGFNPLFRVWGIDEQDISARAWLGGCGVACVVNARVGHLTRQAFPYPVQFEHLEFNQAVMLETVFSRATVERLRPHYQPLPQTSREWLAAINLESWRARLQRARRMTDDNFFARFIPELRLAQTTARKSPTRRSASASRRSTARSGAAAENR